MEDEHRLQINSEHDILTARQRGRELAADVGFSGSDLTIVATAISEIARNIVEYAGRGEIVFTLVGDARSRGIVVVARDEGPGIHDAALAAQTAVDSLIRYAHEPPLSLVRRCHERLMTTRGVAMSVASFALTNHTMSWLGVGNVEGSLFRGNRGSRPARESLLLRGG